MAVDERRRAELFEQLTATIGEDATRTVFELLREASDDVATSGQVAAVRAELEQLSAHVDEQFSRVGEQFARVDEQFARVGEQFARVDERFSRVDEQFARAEEQTDLKLTALRDHLTGVFHEGLHQAVASQTRTLVISQLVALVAIAALAFGLR